MIRFTALRAAQVAATLSLALAAGCAAPVATTPAPVAAQPEAPAAAQPAAPAEAAPAALPAPAAVTPTVLAGTATFHGAPVAGYALTVLDARTGMPVPLKADLAGATGLAVLDKNLTTDAQGRFSLQVVGLTAGQGLRVQVKRGDTVLETLVTSNLQNLGATQYRSVLEVGGEVSINEVTSAIARVARSVFYTTRLLTPEAAAPVLAKLATQMAALSGQLEGAIKLNPGLANSVVTGKDDDCDAAVKTLVQNANALKGLTANIAALVGEVAKGAKGQADDQLKKDLAEVKFVGTVLKGSLKDTGFRLINTLNGNELGADASDLTNVTRQVTPNSSHGNQGTVVTTFAELKSAVDRHDALITLGADIDVNAYLFTVGYHVLTPGATLNLTSATTIDGAGHAIFGSSLTLIGDTFTLKNVTMAIYTRGRPSTLPAPYHVLAASLATFSHVTFGVKEMDEDVYRGNLSLVAGGRYLVTDCRFTGLDGGTNCTYQGDSNGSLTLSHCHFDGVDTGLSLNGAAGAGLSITDNTFDMNEGGQGLLFSMSGNIDNAAVFNAMHDNAFRYGNNGVVYSGTTRLTAEEAAFFNSEEGNNTITGYYASAIQFNSTFIDPCIPYCIQ